MGECVGLEIQYLLIVQSERVLWDIGGRGFQRRVHCLIPIMELIARHFQR